MKLEIGKFLKRKQEVESAEQIQITVVDDNPQLPDFRKITVPDLKQYLANGYKEIRDVKQKNEELKEKLENEKKYRDLYESTLIVLNEFKDRDEENKEIQIKMENKINEKEKEITELKEQVNTYRILETEINKKIENIELIKKETSTAVIKDYKEKLVEEINNTKGNISKSKLFSIINDVK